MVRGAGRSGRLKRARPAERSRIKRRPAWGACFFQRPALRHAGRAIVRDQDHPVAGVAATNGPDRIGADVAPKQRTLRTCTDLACIMHQLGEGLRSSGRIPFLDRIAVAVSAAASAMRFGDGDGCAQRRGNHAGRDQRP